MAEGADPTGAVDASAIIRAGLATGGDVLIPRGVFTVSRDGANTHCLSPAAGTRVYGSGTLRMAAGSTVSTRLLYVAADDVTVEGITLDGNRANQTVEANPQRHALVVGTSARVTIRDVSILSVAGDAIVLSGDVVGASVVGSRIRDTARNGVTVGSGVMGGLLIASCDIEATVQPIDAEPVTGTNTGARILGNNLRSATGDYALTLTSGTDWIVTGNRLVGAVYVIKTTGVTMTGNVIDATASTALHAVRLMPESDNLIVADNIIRAAPGMCGVYLAARPATLDASRNTFVVTAGGRAIYA